MVILIRHGEAEHNVKQLFDSSIDSRSHLTETGIKQIEKSTRIIVDYCKDYHVKVNRIFCSPLLRTIESARIIKRTMKQQKHYFDNRFCVDYRLREIEMGNYDRKSVHDYPHKNWNFNYNQNYGGESIIKLKKRCDDFLKELKPHNINVVVTHGEPFRCMVQLLSKKDIIPLKGQTIGIENGGNVLFNSNNNEN